MDLKFPRPPKKPRLLRTYSHLAEKCHGPCGQCQRPINSGEMYDAFVYAYRGKISTRKFHTECPGDWLDEEYEKDMDADRRHDEMVTLATPAKAA